VIERARDRRSRELIFAFALAALLAPFVTAAVDLLSVPAAVHQGRPALLAALLARSLASCVQLLYPLMLFHTGMFLLFDHERGPGHHPLRARALLGAVLGAAVVAWIYVGLAGYEPFAWYPPFVVLYALLWIAVAAAVVLAPGRSRWPVRAAAIVLLLGAAAVYTLEKLLFVGHYSTLHLAAVRTAQLLLQLGLGLALARAPLPRRKVTRVVLAAVLALALLLPFVLVRAGCWDRAAADHAQHTTLGLALALRDAGARDLGPASAIALGPVQARDTFTRHNGLPPLPQDFDLTRHNVLLISWEAARFDQTSLADPSSGITPNLLELERRGAHSFSRAYSPSSVTLQSVAALLSMTWPSATELDVGRKTWDGTLRPEAETLAELFDRSGYDTFWIGHDRNGCFSDVIHGLEQGFGRVRLFLERKSNRTRSPEYGDPAAPERPVDEQIVDELLREIDRLAATERRFFGWTFLVSPHAEYLAHYPDRPSGTDLERYRQELSYADAQTGRILDHLRRTGRDRDTVVILVGDHGEEFAEHGGRFHGSTLHDEQARVLMQVWLPGVHGARIERPTSPMYVFPWLLLRGDAQLRAAANERIQGEIAPLMLATDGGVPMEILSRDKMQAGLVLADHKIVKHLVSGAVELYDLRADPGERRNLIETHPDAQRLEQLLERYLAARDAVRRYSLTE
jgi:arylsulfatase A-like enzyme